MNKEEINEMYKDIAESLEITNTMYENAVRSYKALSKYLSNMIKVNVDIYSQGSIRLGTIIKPINKDDDYDVDLVCLVDKTYINAKDLKLEIGDALKESDKYLKMLSKKEGKRCWTLNFSENSHFHMDVLPAVEDITRANNSIKITEKEGTNYKYISSNPKDFANWFDKKCELSTKKLLESRKVIDQIEKIPEYKAKTTLQKTIQLLKRHRDIKYINKSDMEKENKPASIIITTIVSELYTGEEDIYDLLNKFVTDFSRIIKFEGGVYILPNPVNTNENFLDRWIGHKEKEIAFFNWINDLKIDMFTKSFATIVGVEEQASMLKATFGDELINEVYEKRALRNKGKLFIDKHKDIPIITINKTDTKVQKHNFYGKN